MAQEKRTFIGGMDFDTDARYLKQGDYRTAINMKPSGENDGMGTLENIVGSEFIDNTNTIGWNGTTIEFNQDFSLDADSLVIGKYRDEVYDRIIYFIRETDTECSIYEYSQKQNAISVIVDKFDLGFDEDHLITGVNVIAHGEPWAPDGLLYFTDNLNPPRKINIAKAKVMTGVESATISGGKYYSAYHNNGFDTDITHAYGSLTERIFDAAKYPPVYSPECLFGSDTSVKQNNVVNNQWQFKYRYVYDDKEKSAYSPISKIKTSSTGTGNGDSDFTTNNYIEIKINSGTKEVRFIEVVARKTNLKGDFFTVEKIPVYNHTTNPTLGLNQNVHSSSSTTGVASVSAIGTVNTDFYYRFYNSELYEIVNLKESVKPFDNIPLKAKSQEIIDGNRLVYGNVVDGRNGVDAVNVDTSLHYKEGAGAIATPDKLDYSINVQPLSEQDPGSFIGLGGSLRAANYDLRLNFSNLISGGNVPNNTNINISINKMGFVYTSGVDAGVFGGYNKEGNLVEGVVSFDLSLTGLPQLSASSFLDTVLDALQADYTTTDDLMPLLFKKRFEGNDLEEQGNDEDAPTLVAGHRTESAGNSDNILWKSNGTDSISLRFSIRNENPIPQDINNDYGYGFGFDWDDAVANTPKLYVQPIVNSPPLGSTFYNSPTSGYTGNQIEFVNGGSFQNDYAYQYYALQPASAGWSPNKAGTDMIRLEYFTLALEEAENMGFKSGAYHNFGIVYYDEANRSSSVQKIEGNQYVPFFTDRPNATTQFSPSAFSLEIKHEAPSWAKTWQIVYSGNRNMEKCWQFRVSGITNINGRYLMGIKPLNNLVSKAGLEALVYDYVDGDRMRPIANGGNTIASDSQDFKITGSSRNLGLLSNPGGYSKEFDAQESGYNLNFLVDLDTASAGDNFPAWAGLISQDPMSGLFIDVSSAALAGNGDLTNFFAGGLIEIYRPKKAADDEDIFYYEIGEVHPVVESSGDYLHHVDNTTAYTGIYDDAGASDSVTNQNQTAINGAAGTGSIVYLDRGDVYHRFRLSNLTGHLDFIEDFNASDFFASKNWDAGRVNVVNPDYRETRRQSTVFYSEPFIANTNINGVSSIFPDDTFEEFDKTYGSIQKLHSRENQLIIFQEDKVSRAQVNRNIITTGSGDQILTAQGAVISQAIPYAGEYGISFNPESFSEYAEVLYFTDIKRGAVCRLSQNGISPISEYQMKNYFTDFFTILNRKDISTPSSPNKYPKLYGCFNPKDKEYMLTLNLSDWNNIFKTAPVNDLAYEARESTYFDNFGIRNSYSNNAQTENITSLKKQTLAKLTVVFSEPANRWTYFKDIYGVCEYINNEVVNIINPFKINGSVGGSHDGANLYVLRRADYNTESYNPENYNEFYSQEEYGTQTNGKNLVSSDVVLVSNIEPSTNKVYNSIGVEANLKPTDFEIQNNYRQYSKIFNGYWKTKENYHYSNIYGDVNSFLAYDVGNKYAGIINGEKIRSASATMRCSWTDNNYLRLFAINIGVSPSSKSGVI